MFPLLRFPNRELGRSTSSTSSNRAVTLRIRRTHNVVGAETGKGPCSASVSSDGKSAKSGGRHCATGRLRLSMTVIHYRSQKERVRLYRQQTARPEQPERQTGRL